MKETYFLLQTYEIFLKILYFNLLQEYLKNEIIGFTDCENNEETAYYTVTDIQRSITEVYDGISNLVWKSGYTAFGQLDGETAIGTAIGITRGQAVGGTIGAWILGAAYGSGVLCDYIFEKKLGW